MNILPAALKDLLTFIKPRSNALPFIKHFSEIQLILITILWNMYYYIPFLMDEYIGTAGSWIIFENVTYLSKYLLKGSLFKILHFFQHIFYNAYNLL